MSTTAITTGSALLLSLLESPWSESRLFEGVEVEGAREGGVTTQSKVLGRAGTGWNPCGHPVLQIPPCKYCRAGSLPQDEHLGVVEEEEEEEGEGGVVEVVLSSLGGEVTRIEHFEHPGITVLHTAHFPCEFLKEPERQAFTHFPPSNAYKEVSHSVQSVSPELEQRKHVRKHALH